MQDKDTGSKKLLTQEIDYLKILKILLSRWYWIAGSMLLSYIIGSIYLWYTPKVYATFGTVKLEEKKSEFSDLVSIISNNDRGASKTQSEIFVLQSRTLLLNAIKDLDYRISFFIAGRVRTTDVYPQKQLDIQLLKFDSLNFYHDLVTFKPVDVKLFTLEYNKNGKTTSHIFHYNTPIQLGETSFTIKYPGELSKNTSFIFKFNIPEDFLGRVKAGLRVNETFKNSNVISLQHTDTNPQFASDFLNALMVEYLNYDKNQKTQSASQMIKFIDNQLDYLSKQVKGSENSIKSYKEKTQIMDVNTSAEQESSKSQELETQRSVFNLQLSALNGLIQQISLEKTNVNIGFDLDGTVDSSLSGIINTLETLINDKNRLLKTYNVDSQPIQDINNQIIHIKSRALSILNASKVRLEKNIALLDENLSDVHHHIAMLPAAERDFINLKRDFEINQKVYSYLSEKKLEAQISRSAILPGATIVEPAQANFAPVSPDVAGTHRSSLIYGLIIGLGSIILIRILNPYIYDKETVESLTSIPIIGVIRKYPYNIEEHSSKILAISRPRSLFAESVRSVRTNISFLAGDKINKVICITSEVAGEGKSFVAINLSSTLSLIDKKVVLIAADLRRSKLHKTFNVSNNVGLSNYLANQCSINDIIIRSDQENLDFIPSGIIPPNPSELLHSDKMKDMIEELKTRYDVVMIDTAPVGLVSDAIPLIRLSDINLFVIRSGKSKLYAATIPQRLTLEYQIQNTAIILNAFREDLLHSRYYTTKYTGDNYGNAYYYSDYNISESSGYYIDDVVKKKWWKVSSWFKS